MTRSTEVQVLWNMLKASMTCNNFPHFLVVIPSELIAAIGVEREPGVSTITNACIDKIAYIAVEVAIEFFAWS